MNLTQTGLILFVKKYEECVSFYRDIINLGVLFTKTGLTCFDFNGSYLLIEEDSIKERTDSVCLRFNVTDFDNTCKELTAKGVKIEVSRYNWGCVGRFKDPEGNNCSIKDSQSFDQQIIDNKKAQ